MKNILLLIFVAFLINSANAQDFKSDIKKMHEAYLNTTSFSGKMKVRIYVDNKISMTKKAIVNKHHNQFLYTMDGRTMLINENYALMIDQSENIMVMDKMTENAFEDKIQLSQLMFEKLDTFLNAYHKWEFLGDKNGKLKYLVYLPNQTRGIKRVQLNLEKRNFTISKLIYYYGEEGDSKNRVVIDFKENNLQPKFSKSFFSEKKFVTKVKNKWKPIPQYEKYDLILANNDQ